MLGAIHSHMICILHSVEVIDATPWYSIFSMVVMPINSVINPLLYDDVVTSIIRAPVKAMSNQISNSTIYQTFLQKTISAPAEDIEIQRSDTDVGKAADTTQKCTAVRGYQFTNLVRHSGIRDGPYYNYYIIIIKLLENPYSEGQH